MPSVRVRPRVIVKRVTVGTPLRLPVGASGLYLNSLLDVNTLLPPPSSGDVLGYTDSGSWKSLSLVDLLESDFAAFTATDSDLSDLISSLTSTIVLLQQQVDSNEAILATIPRVTVSPDPPLNPNIGDLWIEP